MQRRYRKSWPGGAAGRSLQTAEKDGPGYAAFLDRLLEEEVGSREERRVKNALKLAGFPFLKTLDSFDFAFQPSLDRGRVMDLASPGFIARKENVLLLGPPGVGKSHLAAALTLPRSRVQFSRENSPVGAGATGESDEGGGLRVRKLRRNRGSITATKPVGADKAACRRPREAPPRRHRGPVPG